MLGETRGNDTSCRGAGSLRLPTGSVENVATQQGGTSEPAENSTRADLAFASAQVAVAVCLALLRFGCIGGKAAAHPHAGEMVVLARGHFLAPHVPLIAEVASRRDDRHQDQCTEKTQTRLASHARPFYGTAVSMTTAIPVVPT